MKKMMTVIVFAMLVITGTMLTAKTVTITRQGGGPSGYDKVTETHNVSGGFLGIGAENDHKLICKNPGSAPCDWVEDPITFRVSHADDQIQGGSLSGTYTEVITTPQYGTIRVTVTWNAVSIYNCEIVELQEQL